MIFQESEWDLTCKDFEYTGVDCCPSCHYPDTAGQELRVVRIDNKRALLCCNLISFFYPDNPDVGMMPEEKLLRAIFGEKAGHQQDD